MENEINQDRDMEAIRQRLMNMGIRLEGRTIEFGRREEVGPDGKVHFVDYVHVEKGDELPGPMFDLKNLGL